MPFLPYYEEVANNTDFFEKPKQLLQFMQTLTATIDVIQAGTDENAIRALDQEIHEFAKKPETKQPLDLLILPLLAINIKETGLGQQSYDFFSQQRTMTTKTVADFLYKEFIVSLVSYGELNLALRRHLFDFTFNNLHKAKGDAFFDQQLATFKLLRPSQQLLVLNYASAKSKSKENKRMLKELRKTHRAEITDLLASNETLISALLKRWKIHQPLLSLSAFETQLMRYVSSGRSMKAFSLLVSKQMILLLVILLWGVVIGGISYNIYLFNLHWQAISEKNQTVAKAIKEFKPFK